MHSGVCFFCASSPFSLLLSFFLSVDTYGEFVDENAELLKTLPPRLPLLTTTTTKTCTCECPSFGCLFPSRLLNVSLWCVYRTCALTCSSCAVPSPCFFSLCRVKTGNLFVWVLSQSLRTEKLEGSPFSCLPLVRSGLTSSRLRGCRRQGGPGWRACTTCSVPSGYAGMLPLSLSKHTASKQC